jgi:hypothetical protein
MPEGCSEWAVVNAVLDAEQPPAGDRAFARAWEGQGELTSQGQHRSAGPVDLMVAAIAELHGLTLLHHDRDFGVIARVTGQPVRWYGGS